MRHRTLLAFTVGFASGIVFANEIHLFWIFYAILAVFPIASACLSGRLHPGAVFIAGVAFGALRLICFYPPGWNVDAFASPAPVTIVGVLTTDPNINPLRSSFDVRTSEIGTRHGLFQSSGITEVLIHGAALDSVQSLRDGDSVVASGMLQKLFPSTNPGEFDEAQRLLDHGVSGELVVQRPHGVTLIHRSGIEGNLEEYLNKKHAECESALSAGLSPDEGVLLSGIMFGDRSNISAAVQNEFAETGTSHVLATAGLHIGILTLCVLAFLEILPLPRKLNAGIIVMLLWAFALAAGARPSVIRAVIVATAFFSARLLERVPDPLTSLAAAALIILSSDPPVLFEADFQLSFVTVAGLVLAMPTWERWCEAWLAVVKQNWTRKLAVGAMDILGLSVIAQAFSAPLSIYYFDLIPVYSVAVNLLVVPLLFVLIPCSVLGLFLSIVAPPLHVAFIRLTLHPLLLSLSWIVGKASGLPGCAVAVAQPNIAVVIGLYVLMFGGALFLQAARPASVEATAVELAAT